MIARAASATAAAVLAIGCASPGPDRAAPVSPFREAAVEAGLEATHFAGATGKFYMPEIMGSGAALIDYDDDGDLDVFLVQATDLDQPGRGPGHQLFRNELIPSGELRFVETTAHAGVGKVMYGMGAATGDYDGDGDVDLYVTGFGPNALFRNRGDGSFEVVPGAGGAQDGRFSTGAAFLDYDRDGDLDLFVLNYCDFTVAGKKACTTAAGAPDYCTPRAYQAVSDRLFRNDGEQFVDATLGAGIASERGPGLGIVVQDFNDDGWIDVYVANDTQRNFLWINRRDGTFAERGLEAGAALAETGIPRAGMGVGAGDYDNDGDDDVAVFNLTGEGATLFENDGLRGALPSFRDVTAARGLRAPTLPNTGFGADWLDYDNDGLLDLFVANGAAMVLPALGDDPWPFRQPNQLFRNVGGRRFQEVEAFDAAPGASRGAVFGDSDNDGDVDLLVTNGAGPVHLYLNQSGGRSLSVRVPPHIVGARIGLTLSDGRTLWRRAHVDSSYLSAGDPRAHFGLGPKAEPVALEVVWPDGQRESFRKPPEGWGREVRVRPGAVLNVR